MPPTNPYFESSAPTHLVRPGGGLRGEIFNLRQEVAVAFQEVHNDIVVVGGGTGVYTKGGVLIPGAFSGDPKKAALWLGKRYDYVGLVSAFFVMVARWLRRKIRNPLQDPRGLFCSEAVAHVLQQSRYPGAENLDPSATTPEDLRVLLHQTGARIVPL